MSNDANYYDFSITDLEIEGDNIHLLQAGTDAIAERSAAAFLNIISDGSYRRGPIINSAVRSGTTVTVGFDTTNTDYTAITPSTAIAGFNFLDDGAGNAPIAINSAVTSGANIVLTLASAPVGDGLLQFAAYNANVAGSQVNAFANYPTVDSAIVFPVEPLYADFDVALAGTAPVITGVSGNNANGTWTITMSGGYTSPVSPVVWNGYSLTNIQEINGTQITADADFSGEPNVLQDLIVTDAGGASPAFQVVKLPAVGYLYVAATDSEANFPAWSYLKGITAIALNDGVYVEQDIGFGLTADQHLTSIDGVGVINYLDPNSYSGDVVRLDSASNYAADAPEVVNLNVGDNVPPVQAITPVTGATPSQSYEGKFDILTKTDDPVNGVDLGVTMNVTAESNATLEFSNDDTNWFTSIDVTETTQGRLTVVAPGAGQTLIGTGDANTTQFSFSVTSAVVAAITDTISSTNPNDTITPVTSTLIDCYGHTVDGVSSNYEQVTTDGSGVFNLVDAGWTTGTWIVSFRDNATENDLGVQTYVVT